MRGIIDETETAVCKDCGKVFKRDECKVSKDEMDSAQIVNDSMLWSISPTDYESARSMGLIEPFKSQQDGSLMGRTVGTTIGVYTYKNQDGTVSRRLRAPEEVFSDESVASLALVPVTDGHPRDLVTPENYKTYSVGSVGDVRVDAYRIYPKLRIVDKTAIENVRSGKKYLSCGYTAEIVKKSGVWNGVAYDEVQTKIRYNHIAIVDSPRAGDEAVMHFDGLEIQQSQEIPMKKIIIDGSEYEADEALAGVVASMQQAKTQLDSKIAAFEGERDTLKAELEKVKSEAKTLSDSMPSSIESAVKVRLALIDSAKVFGVQVTSDQTDRQVREACLKIAGVAFDGKDEVYVQAAFDTALTLRSSIDVGAVQLMGNRGSATQSDTSDEDPRVNMIKNMKAASRGEAQ